MPFVYRAYLGLLILLLGGSIPLAWAGDSANSGMASVDLLCEAPIPSISIDAAVKPLSSSELLPGVAASLAIAPGIVLHGAGHFYAGRPWTGATLLLVEGAALYMAGRGGWELYTAGKEFNLEKNQGRSGPISNSLGLAAGGVMLFLGSWLYDLTGAPIAAAETNATRHHPPTAPTVSAQLIDGGVQVVFQKNF